MIHRVLPETPVQDPAKASRWSPAPLIRVSFWWHIAGVLSLIAYPMTWPWVIAALLGNHVVLGVIGMWPRSRLLGPNLVRLPAAAARRGEVALTFDDGPDPEVTPQVLDLLDHAGAKASFFCLGARAAAHPEIVRDMVRRGHSVENHSHRHPNTFACYGLRALRREIEAAQKAIAEATGRRPAFFRAPIGLRSPLLDPVLARTGLRYVSWTRRGYDAVRADAAGVLRRLTRGLAAGDVLLLHDGSSARTSGGQPVVLQVLPALLEQVAAQGLKAVTLPAALDDESKLQDAG